MRQGSWYGRWHAGSARRSAATVSTVVSPHSGSCSVRIQRSAQPLPAGARTQAGERVIPTKVRASCHPGTALDCHEHGGVPSLGRSPAQQRPRRCGLLDGSAPALHTGSPAWRRGDPTLRRVLLHRTNDRPWPLLTRGGRRHRGPPHRLDLRREKGAQHGLWGHADVAAVWGPAEDGHASGVGPGVVRCGSTMPPPCPSLPGPLAWAGRRCQDTPAVRHALVLRPRTQGPPAGSRRGALAPRPVHGGACAPHATDPRQAIRRARGGRGGLAHVSPSWAVKGGAPAAHCAPRNSAMPMVASPNLARRRPLARSRLSRGGVCSASWPAARNASRQAARRAAGTPHARDTRASASPRSRRHTPSNSAGRHTARVFPPMYAPLFSRSARFVRGDLSGNLLWMHLDTSYKGRDPMRCPIKLYTKPLPACIGTRYVYPHAATTINGVSLTCDYNGNLTHCVSK